MDNTEKDEKEWNAPEAESMEVCISVYVILLVIPFQS